MSNLAAVFGAGFDTNSVEPQKDFDLIPPGKYPVSIDKAEVLQTKKQDGYYLKVCMTILDGQYRNRKLWDNINIQNPSQQCTTIGLGELSALGKATGVPYVSDENQFLGKTCIAHVKIKNEQNEIRTYSAMATPTATHSEEMVQKDYNQQYTAPPTQPPVAPMQIQPPMQPPTVQSPVAPQGAAGRGVGPTGQNPGIPPWKR